MAPKKGENTKKVAGNAKKAEAAAAKQAVVNAKSEAAESEKWGKGGKDTSKADAANAKAAEAARKKAEKAALLAEEEASLPSKPVKSSGAKKAGGVSRPLDLSGLDAPSSKKELKALNASGIDDALDALNLAGGGQGDKVDRHPERRFKAAYTVFEERRLEEMKDEKGLRRQQKIDMIRKEFEKHPDNPFNQVHAQFDTSKTELKDIGERERDKTERRLGGP